MRGGQQSGEGEALQFEAVQRVPELVASQLMTKGQEPGEKEKKRQSRRVLYQRDERESKQQFG